MNDGKKSIPEPFRKKLRDWQIVAKSAFTLHYLCGIGGVTCASIAASEFSISKLAAIASAAAFGVLGFVQPLRVYHQFMSARRILQSAMLRYEFEDADVSVLVGALKDGERLIQRRDEEQIDPSSRKPRSR